MAPGVGNSQRAGQDERTRNGDLIRSKTEAQKQWQSSPAPMRACPKCNEIAFTPGQIACAKRGVAVR
jgi:hypothetical protein